MASIAVVRVLLAGRVVAFLVCQIRLVASLPSGHNALDLVSGDVLADAQPTCLCDRMGPVQRTRASRLLLFVKALVLAIVLAGVSYAVWKAFGDVRQRGFSMAVIDLRWLVLAGIVYLLGLATCWLFWHQTLHAMEQTPTLGESLCAYYLSQLGKYVPGKAMVVVLRTAWIRGRRTDTTVAAVSVFVETLTMMAVGACTASAILSVAYRQDQMLLFLALGMMVCAGVPTLPPVLRRVVHLLQIWRANPQIGHALAGVNFRLMLQGWCAIEVGWWLQGLSLWAVLSALTGELGDLSQIPSLTACVALAVVIGFVSMVPGGLGVRELVIFPILVNGLGYAPDVALVGAVVLRLVWLLSEVAVSIILYVGARVRRKRAAPSQETYP